MFFKMSDSVDSAVEVVIAPALEQIASDVTCLYNFLNRVLKVSSFLCNDGHPL